MTHPLTNTLDIYVAQEQELYRNIFQTSFEADAAFRFLGITSNGDEQALMKMLISEKPDVLAMGTRKIHDHPFQEIDHVCTEHPRGGLVI